MDLFLYEQPSAPFFITMTHIDNGSSTISHQKNPLPSGNSTKFHKHSHYELIYVLEGEFTQHFENAVFRYQKGDACLLNRNIRHCEGFESECQILFINMLPEFIDSLYAANQIQPSVPQYTSGAIRRFITENQQNTLNPDPEYIDFASTIEHKQDKETIVAQLITKILKEAQDAATGYAFRIQAYLLELLAELENPDHYHLTRIRVNAKSEDFIFARLIRYMEECRGNVSRDELKQILHYDGDYLNRIVKKQLNMTLSQLGQQICLREARKLLAETDMSISAIIADLGYTNRSHFYRLFNEHVGMSPQQYRNTILQVSTDMDS